MSTLRKIDPLLLEAFVAIVETGSFSAAAQRIGRTPSAISMQMTRLEALFAPAALFQVHGRRKRLTARGEVLLTHARRILQINDSLWNSMAAAGGPHRIRFGTPDDYLNTLLPNVLDRFAAVYPEAEVELTCEPNEALNQLIERSKIDLAVVTKRPDDRDSEVLRSEPIVWVCASREILRREPTMPLALFQPGCLARQLALDACVKAQLPHKVAYSSPSLSGVLTPVRAGLAAAPIARCSVPPDLLILDEADGMPMIEPLVLALKRSKAPLQGALVDFLANEISMELRR